MCIVPVFFFVLPLSVLFNKHLAFSEEDFEDLYAFRGNNEKQFTESNVMTASHG